jgi:D-galactarolactone isomerase
MQRLLGRREVIKMVSGVAATAVVSLARPDRLAAQQVKWSAGTEPAKLRAPPNAADCHHHI